MTDQLSNQEGLEQAPVPEVNNAPDKATPTANEMPINLPPKKSGCRRKPCIGECWTMPPTPSVGKNDLKDPHFGRMLGAEYLGTLLLVFVGVMSYIPASNFRYEPTKEVYYIRAGSRPPSTLTISFGFGIVVATLCQGFGHISGAHLNPAVSFGLMIAGKCSALKTLCYAVAQTLGAVTGSFIVWMATHEKFRKEVRNPAGFTLEEWDHGVNVLPKGLAEFPDGMMTEYFLTFVLVFTVVALNDELRKDVKGSAPLAIGLAVFVCHLVGLRISSSGFNPARSFSAACFSKHENRWKNLWVYLVGPLLGGFEGGFMYAAFFSQKPSQTEPELRQDSPV